jgi:hypothetical protein
VFSALYDWTAPHSTKTLNFFLADQNEVEKRNPTMAAYCSILGVGHGVGHVGSGVRIGFSHMANFFYESDLAGSSAMSSPTSWENNWDAILSITATAGIFV